MAMYLRICDGERERIGPASMRAVEQAFAPGVPMLPGTEISLADGDRWLTAVPLDAREGGTSGETEEFLLMSASENGAALSGPVGRSEALQRFREFVLARAAETEPCRRIFP
jgi:hypothetical protein